jgi:glutathione S-transferase
MITLHGFAYSNYYNIVKHALLIKDIPFQENTVYTTDPALLQVSPAGKVPAITTPSGENLSETTAILEYLEEAYPEQPLLPSDLASRARVRQIIKCLELYIELSTRRLLPSALMGMSPDPQVVDEVSTAVSRGVAALNTVTDCRPYLCGDTLTLADIYCRYAMAIPQLVGPKLLDRDIVSEIRGLPELMALLAESEISQRIDADMRDNYAEFMQKIRERQSNGG